LHLPPEHDVEKGFSVTNDEDENMEGEKNGKVGEGILVYIAIAVFATLGIGAWGVSSSIAMGVLVM
jgi:hypothetical protein